jgi:hypothetical protein
LQITISAEELQLRYDELLDQVAARALKGKGNRRSFGSAEERSAQDDRLVVGRA